MLQLVLLSLDQRGLFDTRRKSLETRSEETLTGNSSQLSDLPSEKWTDFKAQGWGQVSQNCWFNVIVFAKDQLVLVYQD